MSLEELSVPVSKEHVDSASSGAARLTGVARPLHRPAIRLCSRGTSDDVESAAVNGSEVIVRACCDVDSKSTTRNERRTSFFPRRLENSRKPPRTVRRAGMSVETRRSVKSHASDAWKRRLDAQ